MLLTATARECGAIMLQSNNLAKNYFHPTGFALDYHALYTIC